MFGKQKVICHVCNGKRKIPKGQELPKVCSGCAADLVNPTIETRNIAALVEKEAGGVMGDLVMVILTDKRLIFKKGLDLPEIGGGGLHGVVSMQAAIAYDTAMAIAKAIRGPQPTVIRPELVYTTVESLASIQEEAVGMTKRNSKITINTKDGETFTMILPNKEAAEWVTELNKHIM